MDGPKGVNARLRELPSIEKLLRAALGFPDYQETVGPILARWSVLAAAQECVGRWRERLRLDPSARAPSLDLLSAETRRRAEALQRSFPRPVLNATGIVLHTNLGRAPLAAEAADAVARAAQGYSELEIELTTGERGSRAEPVQSLLRILSGAGGAMVVNNNAAALFLVLDVLCAGREAVLSRGELVEIGGSFRIPEIMAASRAVLREVGTTNRTHMRDYHAAIGERTGLLLKVHRSNFEIRGFTTEVQISELSSLAREHGLLLVEDRGSGTLVDLSEWGIPDASVASSLDQGADLVLFSGDKLLGGPQAGIILGRGDLVAKLRASPLARVLRVDKMTLAALHCTLLALLDGAPERKLPVLEMLTCSLQTLRARADRIAEALVAARAHARSVDVEAHTTLVGGGSLPGLELPGHAVRVVPHVSVGRVAARLRQGEPPVLARTQRGALLVDPRALRDSEIDVLVERLVASLREAEPTEPLAVCDDV